MARMDRCGENRAGMRGAKENERKEMGKMGCSILKLLDLERE